MNIVPQATGSWSERMLHASLMMLAFVAGLVDAAGFLGMGHIFMANVAGNIIFIGLAGSGVPQLSFVRSAASLAAVFVGSGIAGYLDTRLFWRCRTEWLAFAMGLEAVLLTLSAIAAHARIQQQLGPGWAIWAIILCAGTSMGIGKGTTRRRTAQELAVRVVSVNAGRTGCLNLRCPGRGASNFFMFSGVVCGALLLRFSLCAVLASGAVIIVGSMVLQLIREETDLEAKLRVRIL
jgi:uncharacterized membrane protein YoaK (UPF0700 family)